MFILVYTNRFNKDIKLLKRRGIDLQILKKAILFNSPFLFDLVLSFSLMRSLRFARDGTKEKIKAAEKLPERSFIRLKQTIPTGHAPSLLSDFHHKKNTVCSDRLIFSRSGRQFSEDRQCTCGADGSASRLINWDTVNDSSIEMQGGMILFFSSSERISIAVSFS